MAFPGCVIFLPPTEAAARFLLAACDVCWAGRERGAVAVTAADGRC